MTERRPLLVPASAIPEHGSLGSKWRNKVTRVEFQITARCGDLIGHHNDRSIIWQCETADKQFWHVVTDSGLGLEHEPIEAFTNG